ncbi:MAG: hypothetical protein DRN17_00065 [Thermoplasmata archaeon]|nr:MAG: hypothetical protein DRN17_00065 [Thermoplasmata archaeon]
MADAAWKALERKVAAVLGGQRIAASGNGAIKGDVQHPIYHIECKWGKQIPKWVMKQYQILKELKIEEIWFTARYSTAIPKTILKWYNKAKEQAGDKMTLLIMKPKGIHNEFVFWYWDYECENRIFAFTTLKKFAERYKKLHGKEAKHA